MHYITHLANLTVPSWETTTPRSSIISWTSRKLRQKRKYNQTQWEMISAGKRYPR